MGNTAESTKYTSGDKLYQQRAREALPLLVRQAQIRREIIFYSDLAHQLGMPNPRNLNYVLGSPDLPGCVSTGATREEVERNMQGAIEFHLEGLREEGCPVPEPNTSSAYVEIMA